jgi:acyl-CoA hydrolase
MIFKQPVHLGDLMTCKARVTYVGKTSIEVLVHVHAENILSGYVTHTNSAYVVYVALGSDGKPTPAPGLILETEEDKRHFAEGTARQRHRTGK